jgi:hypothetical protein
MVDIDVSVTTSSSERRLATLATELLAISKCELMDLYVLRHIDLKLLGTKEPAIEFLGKSDSLRCVSDWLHREFQSVDHNLGRNPERTMKRIAALATFFPEITSENEEKGNAAIQAICQSVKLADKLKTCGLTDSTVVEIVCGPSSEHKSAKELTDNERHLLNEHYQERRIRAKGSSEVSRKENIIVLSDGALKRELLMKRLLKIYDQLKDINDWVLALELEPGHYAFNNFDSIEHVFSDLIEQPAYKPLTNHLSINLDVAHMKIAKVKETDLEKYSKWIAHAHICDHPGMHTKDQVIGTWEPIDRSSSSFHKYIELYYKATKERMEVGLPTSRAIAIELEGCNRISWIHESVMSLRHVLLSTKRRMLGSSSSK